MVKEKNVAKFASCNYNYERMKSQKIYVILSITALFLALFSCKEEDDATTELSESVRVTSFSLAEDEDVLENLDTIFFTIDLNRGFIYNADSLPKGTDVSALVANIGFDNVGAAVIRVDKGDPAQNYTIDYVATPEKAIDFTGTVTMEVTSESGLNVKSYSLKVNVHQINPDSLYWDEDVKPLPCGEGVAVDAQKALYHGGKVYSWISVGTTTSLYTAQNPYDEVWDKQELSLSFAPNLKSIQVTNEAFYMLSTEGELFSSEDGVAWSTTGRTFHSLQGAWKSRLLGVIREDGVYKHDYYPRPDNYTPVAVADDFPITGSSAMVTFVSSYDLENPQSIMIGGRTQQGSLTGATWGYDGNSWAQFAGSILPCEGAMLFPYYAFSTNEYWVTTEYTSWMAIGRNLLGLGNAVYYSINNGNTWLSAPTSLKMPEDFSLRTYASAMVVESDYKALPKGWRGIPVTPLMKSATPASDYKIPYIYIFGGEDSEGVIYNEIWRGAIGRKTYPPIP